MNYRFELLICMLSSPSLFSIYNLIFLYNNTYLYELSQGSSDRRLSESSFADDTSFSYKKILVPHDGSEMSDIALRHALYISKISNAEITIIINVSEKDVIAPSMLLSFMRTED